MNKYIPAPAVELPDRTWPGKALTEAPVWCSVDLRDGNQALVEPMDVPHKLAMFEELTRIGFREIEIGFPSASQAEFDTARALIDRGLIPRGTWVQVLTQARENLIRRTFEAVEGAENVIFHLYTNISPQFRDIVYKTDEAGMIALAVEQAGLILSLAKKTGIGRVRFEYSPEGFTESDPGFAIRMLDAVTEAYGASKENPIILNLPSTVQKTMPNLFADRIEHVSRTIARRDGVILSVHPHNDRGTGIAEAELAQLAGAQRVEGTLFGNGERTGNVDIVTLALNLKSQGVEPGLDFSRLNEVRGVYERCTSMRVPERSPYAGDLVFTAFSGSHQDAIKKGLEAYYAGRDPVWRVPYLPLDPKDVGRGYEPIIRINSQSGKGGAAYILQTGFGYNLPRAMHPEFGAMVKREAEAFGSELPPERLLQLFLREYQGIDSPYALAEHRITTLGGGADGPSVTFEGAITRNGEKILLSGSGNGPIDAFFSALIGAGMRDLQFASYHEHAIGKGSDAKACSYIELTYRGRSVFGVGIDPSVTVASLRGVLTAINRAVRKD